MVLVVRSRLDNVAGKEKTRGSAFKIYSVRRGARWSFVGKRRLAGTLYV